MRLAIFASGAGSNARNIIEYFSDRPEVQTVLIVTNNPAAGVVQIASQHHIPVLTIGREDHKEPSALIEKLRKEKIDWIILAGYLWKIPAPLVDAYENKIINIHPALLPKFGGKGMYGHHVHEAVFANRESESGITVHFVNANYDEGSVVFQARVALSPEDQPEDIEKKVRALEIEHFPQVIDRVIFAKING